MNLQMGRLVKGRYSARITGAMEDIIAAQEFRSAHFGDPKQGLDGDRFDNICRHVLVEDLETNRIVACYRFLHLPDGGTIETSYAAQFYNLKRLLAYPDPMLEIGRFCVEQGANDPDILRICWALLTRFVDLFGIGLMFGCTSFSGTDMAPYRSGFTLLKHRHLAPLCWMPQVRAPEVIPYAIDLANEKPDLKQANACLPPLLRSYLAMRGWVSDHAVVDRQLGTLHVFTGVEIAAIPAARKRFLRADAA